MRPLLCLALSLPLLIGSACAGRPLAVPGLAVPEAALDAAWRLSIPDRGGHASGVVVACSAPPEMGEYLVTMLTCAHVAALGSNWTAERDAETLLHGLVVDVSSDADAALIRFRSPQYIAPVTLRWDHPAVGERLYGAGYGGTWGIPWLTFRIVSGHGVSTVPVFFGDSGGPLLDATGRLVGVTWGLEVYQGMVVSHHSAFSPLEDVRGWLEPYLG